jgi:hypothetical protein
MADVDSKEMTRNSRFAAAKLLRRIILLLSLSYIYSSTATASVSRVAHKAPGLRRTIYNAHAHVLFCIIYYYILWCKLLSCITHLLLPTSRLHSTTTSGLLDDDAVLRKIKTNKIRKYDGWPLQLPGCHFENSENILFIICRLDIAYRRAHGVCRICACIPRGQILGGKWTMSQFII